MHRFLKASLLVKRSVTVSPAITTRAPTRGRTSRTPHVDPFTVAANTSMGKGERPIGTPLSVTCIRCGPASRERSATHRARGAVGGWCICHACGLWKRVSAAAVVSTCVRESPDHPGGHVAGAVVIICALVLAAAAVVVGAVDVGARVDGDESPPCSSVSSVSSPPSAPCSSVSSVSSPPSTSTAVGPCR